MVQEGFPQERNHYAVYDLKARNLSYDAMNSYPQTVISYIDNDTLYHVQFKTFDSFIDTTRLKCIKSVSFISDYIYDDTVAIYLEPTNLIKSDIADITFLADSLFTGLNNTLEIIKTGLEFTNKYITFDDSLAIEIGNGKSNTLDVKTILERKKGTCSEYTNLFIALMRNKGIPCRFITGCFSMPEKNILGTHAWAECYIKGCGWWPVDPASNYLALPHNQIKMFYGKDFLDCKINTLPEMEPIHVKYIDK